jgi:16S rRNA processing protein RimM
VPDSYIAIGKITRPQGVRGQVKVYPMTDDANRFLALDEAYVEDGAAYRKIRVVSASVRGSDVFLTVEGAADREAAERFRGKIIYVDREHAVPLDAGQAFICDIIGCAMQTEDGALIGKIEDVIETGANDVFQVKTPKGVLLVPVIDGVVISMKPEDKLVTVNADRLAETSLYQ